jgi:hypothetical protein
LTTYGLFQLADVLTDYGHTHHLGRGRTLPEQLHHGTYRNQSVSESFYDNIFLLALFARAHIDQNAFRDRSIYDTVAEINDSIFDRLTRVLPRISFQSMQ